MPPKSISRRPIDAASRQFLRDAHRHPLLSQEEEVSLVRAWRERQDRTAVNRLAAAYLRLVVKIAVGYRAYDLPVDELIAEGNVGLMRAIRGFDPNRGFRLSTYARSWIHSAIQEYVLRSWSIVKLGTTASQKRLFFRLQRMKRLVHVVDDDNLHPDQIKRIAQSLGVREAEVLQVHQRLTGRDQSLNAPLQSYGDTDTEWQDLLHDERDQPEATVAARQHRFRRSRQLTEALCDLTQRERHIFVERVLRDDKQPLRALSRIHNISIERVRQIQAQTIEKLQQRLSENIDC